MAAIILWAAFFLLVYIYFLYPSIVWLLARKAHGVNKEDTEPFISILISAFNEEAHIGKTLENKLTLDYPKNKLEIIVVSDCSHDMTDEIVRGFSGRGVRLIRQEPRKGKTAALNMVVKEARGSILVFSDANSMYSANALREIAANFADPGVGYVTGRMVYVNPDGSSLGDGCSAYMKYENFLRKAETGLGSVVGVDGGIDAVRSGLFVPMRHDQLPDFILPLKVVEQGYRVVYEPKALLNEDSLDKPFDEYRMRVRVTLRAMHALKDMAHLLNPARYGLFAWQLISHKVLRYAVFILLPALYASNLLALNKGLAYWLIFMAQNAFYTLALIGAVTKRKPRIFYIPFYFSLLNLACAHAFLKFIRRRQQALWVPRRG